MQQHTSHWQTDFTVVPFEHRYSTKILEDFFFLIWQVAKVGSQAASEWHSHVSTLVSIWYLFGKTSPFRCLSVLSVWAGVVLQCGVAQPGVLPQRRQQRYPEGKSSCRRGPSHLWHLGVQLPPQPHQGAAVLLRHVSSSKRNSDCKRALLNVEYWPLFSTTILCLRRWPKLSIMQAVPAEKHAAS